MNQYAREAISEEFAFESPVTEKSQISDVSLPREICYARDLRTLGQILEDYSISRLEIEMVNGRYQVCGEKGSRQSESMPLTKIIRLRFGANDSGIKATKARGVVSCQVSERELASADDASHRKHQKEGKMPDAYSLSQILRGVGFYLDTRNGALLHRLMIEDERVTLEYVAPNGKPKPVEETLKFFYDYWVQMYLRRSDRWKPPFIGA